MILKGYRIEQNRRMIVIPETRRRRSPVHIRAFLEGTAPMNSHRCPRTVAYAGMEKCRSASATGTRAWCAAAWSVGRVLRAIDQLADAPGELVSQPRHAPGLLALDENAQQWLGAGGPHQYAPSLSQLSGHRALRLTDGA